MGIGPEQDLWSVLGVCLRLRIRASELLAMAWTLALVDHFHLIGLILQYYIG